MFRSSSSHTIDDKGRLIIPARFRKVLKAEDDYGIVVSSKDGCIFAFTFSEWKAIEDRLKTVKTAAMQRFKRFFPGECLPADMRQAGQGFNPPKSENLCTH